MSLYQILALGILAVYYTAYMVKLLGQRKKGIQTAQLGKGNKEKQTLRVEKTLQVASFLGIAVEFISVILNTGEGVFSLLRLVGICSTGIGTLVFIVAMITMQDSWRAGIPSEDKTELVTSGIYGFSRNPAFLGFDLVYLGIGIAFFNPVLSVVTLFGVVMFHLQILEEEKHLSKVFGQEYEVYKKRVGRYFWVV